MHYVLCLNKNAATTMCFFLMNTGGSSKGKGTVIYSGKQGILTLGTKKSIKNEEEKLFILFNLKNDATDNCNLCVRRSQCFQKVLFWGCSWS